MGASRRQGVPEKPEWGRNARNARGHETGHFDAKPQSKVNHRNSVRKELLVSVILRAAYRHYDWI